MIDEYKTLEQIKTAAEQDPWRLKGQARSLGRRR